MKILLFPMLVLASAVHAETIECPARYPTQDVALAHDGGRVQPARLSFAYLHLGDMHGQQVLLGPEARKTRGG